MAAQADPMPSIFTHEMRNNANIEGRASVASRQTPFVREGGFLQRDR